MKDSTRYENTDGIRERSKAYVSYGTEAVKVDTATRPAPERAPLTRPAVSPKRQPAQAPRRRRSIARRTKIAVVSLVSMAFIAAITLLIFQVSITSVNADNNALKRAIADVEKEIEQLNAQVDANVSLDDVYEYIETEGLVKVPANRIGSINP